MFLCHTDDWGDLHTVNIRLSPEQVLYTINHAEDDAILCHADFLPLLLPLLPRMKRPCQADLSDRWRCAAARGSLMGNMRRFWRPRASDFDLSES